MRYGYLSLIADACFVVSFVLVLVSAGIHAITAVMLLVLVVSALASSVCSIAATVENERHWLFALLLSIIVICLLIAVLNL